MTALLYVSVVAVGGALGATARWGIAEFWSRRVQTRGTSSILLEVVPWPTMIANAVACFLLGIVVTQIGAATEGTAYVLFLLLAIGTCGGMSTLAFLAMDVIDLRRRGTPVIAVGYLLTSVGASLAFLWLGLVAAR